MIRRYSDKLDTLLILVGSAGAILAGAALPFFSVLLSRVTDSFLLDYNEPDKLRDRVNETSLYFFLLGIGVMVFSFFGLFCWTWVGKFEHCCVIERLQTIFRAYEIAYVTQKSSTRKREVRHYENDSSAVSIMKTLVSLIFLCFSLQVLVRQIELKACISNLRFVKILPTMTLPEDLVIF